MTRNYLFIIVSILYSILCSNGQEHAVVPSSVDSLANSEVSRTVNLMVQQRIQQVSDSIQAAALRLQIENTVEVGKRKALESQLLRKQHDDSLKIEQIRMQIEMRKQNAVGYPLVLGEDTICMIYTNLGSFTASERAETISRKLKDVAHLYTPRYDSLLIVSDDGSSEIIFQDRTLMTITLTDAIWNGSPKDSLATNYAHKITQSLIKYKDQTSTLTILKQIGLSLLVIVVCYLLIRLINIAFTKKVNQIIINKKGIWFTGFKIKDYEVLDADKQVGFVLFCVKIVRYIITIFLLYIALPLLFSIYPLTRRLATLLFEWILSPVKKMSEGFLDYIPNLLTILVILFVMRYVVRAVKYFMNEIASERLQLPGFYPDWAKATYNILRILIYAFSFVMIFPYLPGSDSEVFKGVSVFLGIVFSLGSSSVIANMIAGMVITYMRPFKIGDHIKIGDQTGDVMEKTPFVTRIKTAKKEVVTIPNSNILSSTVINYSTSAAEQGVIFHTTITIGYDVPWRKIHQMMAEAADRTEYVVKEPKPYVLQTSLDDFYVSYQLCAFTKNPEKQAIIYSGLHTNIQDVFNENGVEIMSPHYRGQRDGNNTTIPEEYLPKGYTPPTFNITNK